MAGELNTIISNANTFLTNSATNLGTALTGLNNILNETTVFNWTPVPFDSVAGPGSQTVMTPQEITALNTALDNLSTALSGIQMGQLPPLPAFDSEMAYRGNLWNSSDWAALRDLLGTFVSGISGTDDVASVVTKLSSGTDRMQVALFAQDLQRKQQVLRDAYSAADATSGAAGFSYPNSMTTALKLDSQQKYQFDLNQVARDLTVKIFEWAKSNFQFAVDKQVSLNQYEMDFTTRFNDLLVRAYDAESRIIIEKYKADVGKIVSQVEAKVRDYALRLQSLKETADINYENYRLRVQKYAQTTQESISQTHTLMAQVQEHYRTRLSTAMQSVQSAAGVAQQGANIAIGVASGVN